MNQEIGYSYNNRSRSGNNVRFVSAICSLSTSSHARGQQCLSRCYQFRPYLSGSSVVQTHAQFIMISLLLLGLLHVTFGACPEGQLEYWVTDPQDLFDDVSAGQIQGCLSGTQLEDGAVSRAGTLEVDPDQQYQTMQGFGGGLTNSAAYLIHNSSLREQMLRDLFSPTEGIGISFVRLPMGASDFMARGPAYTFDDEYDPELSNFSIESELEFVIPTILAAREINPDLKVIATPWTAPPWMKDNNDYNTGHFLNNYTDIYADYFVKYLQGFDQNGAHVDALCVQNEPLLEVPYPSMILPAEDEINLIRNLGPKLIDAGIDTKLIIWDFNFDNTEYAIQVMNDTEAREFIDGYAYHGYGGDPSSPLTVAAAHPDKKYYFTEFTGTTADENWPTVFQYMLGVLFVQQVQQGAVTGMLWNLVLNEFSGPTYEGPGGYKTARGILTLFSDDSHYIVSVEYHAIGHMNKASAPGSVRIESPARFGETGDLGSVAFQNPDNTIGIVVYNYNEEQAEDIEVRLNGQVFNFQQLAPLGAVTFRM